MSATIGWIGWVLAFGANAVCILLVFYIRSLARFYREANDGWRRALLLAADSNRRSMEHLRLATDLSFFVPTEVATHLWRTYSERPMEHDA